jgi:hypothetical protein
VREYIIGELEERGKMRLRAKGVHIHIVNSSVKLKVAIASSARRADQDDGIEASKL